MGKGELWGKEDEEHDRGDKKLGTNSREEETLVVSVILDTAKRTGRLCKAIFGPCTAAHRLIPRA